MLCLKCQRKYSGAQEIQMENNHLQLLAPDLILDEFGECIYTRKKMKSNVICFNLDTTELDSQAGTSLPQSEEVVHINSYLDNQKIEYHLEPISFRNLDPLGTYLVPKVNQESEEDTYSENRFIGTQAIGLLTSIDRITTLKHMTSSINILSSRSIVLNVLCLLTMSTNHANLMNRLELIGLSDIRKLVRLMTLTAMNRVEVISVQNSDDFSHFQLCNDFTRFTTHLSSETNACLNHLSVCIAALAQNDKSSSNLVLTMCANDLTLSAVGVEVPKPNFAVTQALVNILSTQGGCSLQNLPKEEGASPLTDPNVINPLTLVDALSACVLSAAVTHENREWASEQLFKTIANKVQILSSSIVPQPNLADLTNYLPKTCMDYFSGHDNRVVTLAYHEKINSLASAGYDGTVRLWMFETKTHLSLDLTLVFHISDDIFGNELNGRLIGHLKWSPTGKYLAAAMDNVINIWPITSSELTKKDWFIEDQKNFITTLTWPKIKSNESNEQDFLLVGKIDGSVTLIKVGDGVKQIEPLVNCSLNCGKLFQLNSLVQISS